MYPAGRSDVATRFVTLRSGLRVRVLEAGPTRGEPVFFVHGWGCSIYVFRRNYAALANAGYRVVGADLKGHGLSDKPLDTAEYTLEAMGRHVLEIMDALALSRAALVGHSLGGALAVRTALQAPERVSHLALLAPVGFGVVNLLRLVQLLTPRLIAPLLPYVVPRWTVAAGLHMVYGGIGTFDARDVDEYWAPTQFPEFVLAMRELLHAFYWDPGERGELSRLAQPTLVMFGTRDRVVQPGALETVVGCLPHGRYELVKGGGHTIAEEAPGQVNAALLAHFADRRAGVPSHPGNEAPDLSLRVRRA
jgi:4,5:9,10-diseco-3-hydroxy-5,9,17-trioxoandrosta-1(10),2-diene-4-oate hydrolase